MGQATIELSDFFDDHDGINPLYQTYQINENDGALKSSWPIQFARELDFVDDDDQPREGVQVRPFITDDDHLGLLLVDRD